MQLLSREGVDNDIFTLHIKIMAQGRGWWLFVAIAANSFLGEIGKMELWALDLHVKESNDSGRQTFRHNIFTQTLCFMDFGYILLKRCGIFTSFPATWEKRKIIIFST
jgi:hypothetical protein